MFTILHRKVTSTLSALDRFDLIYWIHQFHLITTLTSEIRSCSPLSNCALVKQIIVKFFWIAEEITFEYMLIDSNFRQEPKFG